MRKTSPWQTGPTHQPVCLLRVCRAQTRQPGLAAPRTGPACGACPTGKPGEGVGDGEGGGGQEERGVGEVAGLKSFDSQTSTPMQTCINVAFAPTHSYHTCTPRYPLQSVQLTPQTQRLTADCANTALLQKAPPVFPRNRAHSMPRAPHLHARPICEQPRPEVH